MTTDTQQSALLASRATRKASTTLITKYIARATPSMMGATVDEIERATGLPHQTASAIVSGLWHRKTPVVRDTGLRRKTRYGRDAIVWALS